jgi:hypothetical protein
MTDEQPLEPDAVLAPDRSPVPLRTDRRPVAAPRSWLPALRGTLARDPVLTASVLAVAAAAVRAAGLAHRIASRPASGAADAAQQVLSGRVEISWTRIEIRRFG